MAVLELFAILWLGLYTKKVSCQTSSTGNTAFSSETSASTFSSQSLSQTAASVAETTSSVEKQMSDKYIGCRRRSDTMSWYQGQLGFTVNGRRCQRWDKQTPHKHSFTKKDFARLFGVGSVKIHESYCRNPDNSSAGPWCFTIEKNVIREPCFHVCLNPDLQVTCLNKNGWPWKDSECITSPSFSREMIEQSCPATKDAMAEYPFLFNDEAIRNPFGEYLGSTYPKTVPAPHSNFMLLLKESLYIHRAFDHRTVYCVRSESADLMGPWSYIFTPYERRKELIEMSEGKIANELNEQFSLESCRGKCLMRPCFTSCEDSNLKCIEKKRIQSINYQGLKDTSLSGKPCIPWNIVASHERYTNTTWYRIFWDHEFRRKPKKKQERRVGGSLKREKEEETDEEEDPPENRLFRLQLKRMNSGRCLNLRNFLNTDKLPFGLPNETNLGPLCFVKSSEIIMPEPCFPVCEDLAADMRNCIPEEQMKDFEYTGNRSVDVNNNTCRFWREKPDQQFIPGESVDYERNFCRNLDRDENGPWCLGDGFRKQYCFEICDDNKDFELSKKESGEEFQMNPCHDPTLTVWCQCTNSTCVGKVHPTEPDATGHTDKTEPEKGNFSGNWSEFQSYLEKEGWWKTNVIPVLIAVVLTGTHVALVVLLALGYWVFQNRRREIRKKEEKIKVHVGTTK